MGFVGRHEKETWIRHVECDIMKKVERWVGMIYFCADDYGISDKCNNRIEECLMHGVLNKVSVLPNGDIADFKQRLLCYGAKLSLHLNLVEGYPLSDPKEISLLVSKKGAFRYSFVGLFFLSLSNKRKQLQKQLYKELQKQVSFWREAMGEAIPISIDSHQHTHMIPLVFQTLMQVLRDNGAVVECVRIPAEPLLPYLLSPSLYTSYTLSGVIKQWLLKILAWTNRGELKKSNFDVTYFMGVMFSGRVTEEKIKKVLPRYMKLAKKHNKNIEIGLHPGYLECDEELMAGCRPGFKAFYESQWRKREYDALMKFTL